MASSLDPTVLGHLLLLQGTLPAAPDAERLAELLGHGLEQVPGVADAVVCVGGVVYPADSPEADAAAAAARRPEDEREWADGCACPPGACPLDGQGRRRFSLRTSREVYGALFLHLADPAAFKPYEAYVANTANLAATYVEDVCSTAALDRLNRDLDRQVHERAAALQQSEEHLRTTLDSIGDAVMTADTTGAVTRMNPVAERLTGWPAAEAAGRPLDEVFRLVHAQTHEPADSPLARVLASGEVVGLANHTVLLARGGAEYQIADSGAPIRNDRGEITGVVLVFRDVTEEYALQEQLRQSRKMDALGQLAGGIAHDFNNMLSGISGGTELLKSCLPADPKCERYLQMITDSVSHAAELTRKLLACARRESTGTAPVDLHAAARDAAAMLTNTIDRRVRVKLELDAAKSTVRGEATELQTTFLNLGINAAHAMPEGGLLTIQTRTTTLADEDCRQHPFDLAAGDYIEVRVRDTGCGIPAEDQERIFEPFFTTKRSGKGTGLGLAAAYGMAQRAGGAIDVDSQVNQGSCFRLLLPLCEEATTEGKTSTEGVHGQGCILLVDDEDVIREGGREMLAGYGYRVLTAENGREGLETFQAQSDEIDLVILDMIMPEMNGRDCFFKLRELRPDLPVIVASGFTQADDLAELRRAGLAGFIQKPFHGAELSRLVADALNPGSS